MSKRLPRNFNFSRRVKVVLDAGNGTAGPVIHRLLEKLNVEPIELFFEMDGRFPNHHPDPTVPENLRRLARRPCARTSAELGIAFDGDADRIGAVDENGDVIYGDMLLLILRPRDSHAQAGRDVHRRSEVLAGNVRRAERNWAATRSCTRPAIR